MKSRVDQRILLTGRWPVTRIALIMIIKDCVLPAIWLLNRLAPDGVRYRLTAVVNEERQPFVFDDLGPQPAEEQSCGAVERV